jgi:ribosome-associated toxin RatA of RatAB toxin-antitoxin module
MEFFYTTLVKYSCIDMYNLVNNINDYKNFLPWCANSKIEKFHQDYIIASITVNAYGFFYTFSTYNTMIPNKNISLELDKGPFDYLKGLWSFQEVTNTTSLITLNLKYNIKKNLFFLLNPLMKSITNTLIKSFIHQADIIYNDIRNRSSICYKI